MPSWIKNVCFNNMVTFFKFYFSYWCLVFAAVLAFWRKAHRIALFYTLAFALETYLFLSGQLFLRTSHIHLYSCHQTRQAGTFPSKKHPSHALSLVKVILNFHDLNVSFMIITHLPFNVSTKFNFLRENLRGRVQSAPYQLSSFVLHWHTISYSFLCLHCFSHSVTEI